jgi:hypothetical protein
MAPPISKAVTRVYFVEGLHLGNQMVTSRDCKTDNVEMEMHPAGVLIVGKGYTTLVPWARVKSANLD